MKEVPFADKAQKYIHVLPFNTIVFLIFFQAKADVRRDYGAFIASKYPINITYFSRLVIAYTYTFFNTLLEK